MTGNGMIETFRESTPPPSFPKSLIGNPKVFTEGGRFNKAVPNGVIEKVGEV